jgi:hypothetical protein
MEEEVVVVEAVTENYTIGNGAPTIKLQFIDLLCHQ